MKYCPNPECWYALRHHEGQEYLDEITTCADCGTELAGVRPVWTAPAATPRLGLWIRLALTFLVPALVVWVTPKVPLPRLDTGQVERAFGAFAGEITLSVFALALSPILSAFVLVELAALGVPRWRPLRVGGPSGRASLLRATGRVGLVLAGVQSLGLTLYLEGLGLLERPIGLSRLAIVLSLMAGTALLVAVTQLLDRIALGGGFSVLFAVLLVVSDGSSFGILENGLWDPLTGGAASGAGVWVGGAVVAALLGTVAVLRWRPTDAQGRLAVPLPACGVIPLAWSGTVASLITQDAPALGITLALTAVMAVGFGFLFNRPSKVLAFGADARVGRAVLGSAAYVLGLALLGAFLARQLDVPALTLFPLVVAVAMCLDVIAEARAISRHGDLVAVWPEHRLYAAESELAALGRAGIPAMARSVHQRVLWHFFAPFIPIQILVPRARAEEAVRLLSETLSLRTEPLPLRPAEV